MNSYSIHSTTHPRTNFTLPVKGMLICSFIFFIAAAHPEINQELNKKYWSLQNEVEFLALMDIAIPFKNPNNIKAIETQNLTILKGKQGGRLFLQVFQRDQEGNESTWGKKVFLTESRDGFLEWKNRMDNLIASDINNDRIPELLVPTFDINGVPRLHVFSFNLESGTLTNVDFKSQ